MAGRAAVLKEEVGVRLPEGTVERNGEAAV